MAGRSHRLNDGKNILEERLANTSNSGLLMMEMRKVLAKAQVSALNTFIAGVEARKPLPKPGKGLRYEKHYSPF